MSLHLLPAVLGGVVGGASSLLVPRLVAVVPEPEPDPPDQKAPDLAVVPVAEKELYVDIAAQPGLAVRSAVIGLVAGAGLGAAVGWAWPLLYLLPAVALAIALSVIDWHTKRLPTWYLAPAYPVLGVLLVVCGVVTRDWDDLLRAALGWLVMGGFYFVTNLVSPRLVGYGDVRLAGLLGPGLGYLGWPELLVGMYVAFLVFAVPAIVLAVVRRDRTVLKMRMPFGPAMLVGAWIGVVAGAPLVDWYLGTSGYR